MISRISGPAHYVKRPLFGEKLDTDALNGGKAAHSRSKKIL
ncbi:MAG: hypothetical protein VYC82_10195 [Verrucomicrobiota bacterium]|nr:hypothetical protein [Verrucomicrobiota bacterium]